MYNVEKLEQQWIRYRRKKMMLPVLVAFIGVAVVIAAVYFQGKENLLLDTNTTVATKGEKYGEAFSQKEKTSVQKPTVAKLDILSTGVPSLSSEKPQERPKVGQIIFEDTQNHPSKQIKKRKNLLIQVTERGGKDIAVDIENRFEFAKDKSDSLFLAKYYYDKMEYKKSEKWALETNKLDNSIEESWLIFSKSLAKQGKRIDALKVLKAYIDQSGSMKAKRLMDKIRRGKSF